MASKRKYMVQLALEQIIKRKSAKQDCLDDNSQHEIIPVIGKPKPSVETEDNVHTNLESNVNTIDEPTHNITVEECSQVEVKQHSSRITLQIQGQNMNIISNGQEDVRTESTEIILQTNPPDLARNELVDLHHKNNDDINDMYKSDTSISDDMESEFYDFDDDVKDKDWKPPKKNKRCYESGNETDDSFESNLFETNAEVDNELTISNEKCETNIFANVVDHEEIVVNDSSEDSISKNKVRSKPGEAKVDSWEKNVQKYLRMTGKKYKGYAKNDQGKNVFCQERSERIQTESKCSKRCEKSLHCKTISESQRQDMFRNFWTNMNWNEKKMYVVCLVDMCVPKRRTGEAGGRRQHTFKYHLKCGEKRFQICKNMFLSTLGIGEYMVYDWINGVDFNGIPEEGRNKNPRNKKSPAKEYAESFLNGLPKMPSHYCRSSTTKQYIEPVFSTMMDLYRVYKQDCQKNNKNILGVKTFKEVFRSMNLAIFKPRKDQCDTCCAYETKNLSEEEYRRHIIRKEEARKEKEQDKDRSLQDDNLKVITIDTQAVLLCPRLEASALYYKTKLACHNYTVFDVATKHVTCYFWHEGEYGLTADAFATCIYDYLSSLLKRDLEEIIVYSDECGYQNRNVTLANTLLLFAIKNNIVITQKFLEKGHTQMEVGSVHSMIERRLRKRSIYIPQNYVECIEEARLSQPYKVKYLAFDFFKSYSSLGYYSSIRPGSSKGDPVVTDIRVLKYTPSGDIQYKLHYSDEFVDMPRRATRAAIPAIDDDVGSAATGPSAIKGTKYNHLQQLKAVIPKDYHSFYDNLKHDN